MERLRAGAARALLALMIGLGVWLAAASARAQSAPEALSLEGDEEPARPPAEDEEVAPRRAREVTPRELDRRVNEYIRSGQDRITIYQIVEEMIDDFIADSRDLNIAAISPLALRGVALTPNLSAAFGTWVEAELTNAVVRHSEIRVKRCVSCSALKTRMDGDDWVVSLGHVTQEDLAAEGKKLGVVAFMDAYLAYVPGANVVSLNIQIYRASDGRVLWTETYRSDATTAAILRSGDRVLTREEARDELVRKLEERPYYGYQILGGAGFIPYDSPTTSMLSGAMIGGRLYEKWGKDRRFLYGFHGESFINLGQNSLLGGFLGATMQYQLNKPNLNEPIYRAGGIVQGFIAGTEGNSFAIEGNLEAILQFRYGASIGAFYFFPTTFAGYDLGGFGLKARFMINW